MSADPPTLRVDSLSLDLEERLQQIARGRLLIRQGEAAKALGISRQTLVDEIAAGRLRWVKIGKTRRFKPNDLISYIQKQELGGWQHQNQEEAQNQKAGGRASSSSAARSTTRVSPSGAILDFASALAQATGTSPKPSRRKPARRRSSANTPGRNPTSR
jgi:excisionase family DNA binding protein